MTSANALNDTWPLPGQAPEGHAVLDMQSLDNLRQLDPTGANQLLPRVMKTYRTSLARLLAQLATAREQGDTGSVRLVAHTLKSSSASVGALNLAAVCGLTEQAARDGQLEVLGPLLDQLVSEAANVDNAVNQLIAVVSSTNDA